MFNPRPRIDAIAIADGHVCYVVDDALLEPQRWVDYAAERATEFERSPHNAYPGPELRMPDEISANLDAFFATHVRRLLHARRTLRMYSRLSLATASPETLNPRQWICHRDRMAVETGQCIAASVLYLFRNSTLGGTSFFIPRRPAHEIAVLVHESGTLPSADFARKYGLPPGYMTASNAWFEKVLTVPAQWNRLIFYDGSLFHCGDIASPDKLSDDPRTGRLTLNGFFTCRRNASS